MRKKVLIIGAGPGGLSAGMLLSHKGFDVHIFEKQSVVGGRNAKLTLGDFHFDIGPTFLMYTSILSDIFQCTGHNINDYLEIRKIDPMYRLLFKNNVEFLPTNEKEKMLKEINRVFPGDEKGYLAYMEKEGKKFEAIAPILSLPYDKLSHLIRPKVLKALPRLDITKSLYELLSSYFQHENMRTSMTFQAKYLGMSPWECPAMFSILSYLEHKMGIYHVIGGLNNISTVMSNIINEQGGNINLSSTVEEIIIENSKAKGIKLSNGEIIYGDYLVINSDFAYSMTNLVNQRHRKKYTDEKLKQKKYSCSTFMIYLGLNKKYDIPHHNIIFSDDYKENVNEIIKKRILSEDPSIYVHNPSVIDPTLAPEGKSSLYILVPVPNTTASINWEKEKKTFRDEILNIISKKTELKDIESHIEVEKIISPLEWTHDYNVYNGAVFNLSHNINQLLINRPHNHFEEFENCYLVGGGTSPGSGLPTIYQSAQISANLIIKHALL